MVNLRRTRKAEALPVEERGLGEVKKEASKAKLHAWTDDVLTGGGRLLSLDMEQTLRDQMSAYRATSSPWVTTTTGAGSSYIPYVPYVTSSGSSSTASSSVTSTGYPSFWFNPHAPIPRPDMLALVDKLVKERYPAYEPLPISRR